VKLLQNSMSKSFSLQPRCMFVVGSDPTTLSIHLHGWLSLLHSLGNNGGIRWALLVSTNSPSPRHAPGWTCIVSCISSEIRRHICLTFQFQRHWHGWRQGRSCSARNHRTRILLAILVNARSENPMATNLTRTHTNAHTPHGKNHSVVTTRTIHIVFIHFFTESPTRPRQARRTARPVRSGSCFHNFGLLLIQYKRIQHSP